MKEFNKLKEINRNSQVIGDMYLSNRKERRYRKSKTEAIDPEDTD